VVVGVTCKESKHHGKRGRTARGRIETPTHIQCMCMEHGGAQTLCWCTHIIHVHRRHLSATHTATIPSGKWPGKTSRRKQQRLLFGCCLPDFYSWNLPFQPTSLCSAMQNSARRDFFLAVPALNFEQFELCQLALKSLTSLSFSWMVLSLMFFLCVSSRVAVVPLGGGRIVPPF